jgi:hypothetical protein
VSIGTRLRILEQRILPAEAQEDTWNADAWRDAAPTAVTAYYEAIVDEVYPDWRERDGSDEVNDRAHAAHPLLSQVTEAVQIEVAHHGQPVHLRRVQWRLLSDATYRLKAVVARERGRLYDPETSWQTWRRMYNGGPLGEIATIAGKAWNDRSGETWVRVWRECGTSDPDVLALAGLHAAELALLAADE